MIKSLAFAGLALSSSIAYAACPTGNTTTLCFDEASSDLSKILTQKEQLININGDKIIDKIYVDETTKEIAVKLGRECSAGSDDICFDQPFYTGILNNKGFLADDLSGNGIPEITVRTDQDVIKVYNLPGFSQGGNAGDGDDRYRIGDPEYISILGTNGLTESNYSASTVRPSQPQHHRDDATILGAFDGYLHQSGFPGHYGLPLYMPISPLANTVGGRLSQWQSVYTFGKQEGEWLQIEFNTPVSISSFEVYNRAIGADGGHPTTASIQYSNDGINFQTHYSVNYVYEVSTEASLRYPQVSKKTLNKPTPFAKIIRVYFHKRISQLWSGQFSTIAIDDLLLKGWIKPTE